VESDLQDSDDLKRERAPLLPSDTTDWTVGRRASRPDGKDAGTIVEAGDEIKVKWDSGRTSYFQRGKASNVLLEPLQEN
jgi:hypothetical protein